MCDCHLVLQLERPEVSVVSTAQFYREKSPRAESRFCGVKIRASSSSIQDDRFVKQLRRFFPLAAFFAGFVSDALTIGQRVTVIDFWRLGAYLFGAAVFSLWLAWRHLHDKTPPPPADELRGKVARLIWQAPYLIIQFFFGGIFSALFILYFKSSGHLGSWLTAAILGGLLVANEFAGDRYGRRFTLTWALFALNAILLLNFVLPHLAGSLDPRWFYASTMAGGLLAHSLRLIAPGRPGRIQPAWSIAVTLLVAWNFGMIAPVPLVKRDMAVGHDFVRKGERFLLQVEQTYEWQFWRGQSAVVTVPEGERLYGVSAVYAPLRVAADLEHRWEVRESGGWRLAYRDRFRSTGGRERGFRGYSWILNPQPGEWRFIVATQDGRTIGLMRFRVARGYPDMQLRVEKEF